MYYIILKTNEIPDQHFEGEKLCRLCVFFNVLEDNSHDKRENIEKHTHS